MTITHISQLLKTEEAAQLLAACPQAQTLEGISAQQAEDLIQWAEGIRLANACLELALKGRLEISFVGGEPIFGLTTKGGAK